MSAPRTFIASVIAFFALFAAWTTALNTVTGQFDGTVKLYSSTNYQNLLLSIKISYPNECYNIDCSFLDDKVASATWTELPKTEVTGKTYLVFYQDADCAGKSVSIPYPRNNSMPVFPANVRGDISAFMVKSPNKELDNGDNNICLWTGASVGGSVSEDNSIIMVIPKSTT